MRSLRKTRSATSFASPRELLKNRKLTFCRALHYCKRSKTMRTTSGKSLGRKWASLRRYVIFALVGTCTTASTSCLQESIKLIAGRRANNSQKNKGGRSNLRSDFNHYTVDSVDDSIGAALYWERYPFVARASLCGAESGELSRWTAYPRGVLVSERMWEIEVFHNDWMYRS